MCVCVSLKFFFKVTVILDRHQSPKTQAASHRNGMAKMALCLLEEETREEDRHFCHLFFVALTLLLLILCQ